MLDAKWVTFEAYLELRYVGLELFEFVAHADHRFLGTLDFGS